MSKFPKGNKGLRAKLRDEKQIATIEIKRALVEASKALDAQGQEVIALKRILISERAQVIYYTELTPCARDFKTLPEEQQEIFIKRAVRELVGSEEECPKLLIS